MLDQEDPKSPWHDPRVRLAASHAIDRKAIAEADSLGASPPMGSLIPPAVEFALPVEPHRYDAVRARALLREAGYPNGFDAGEMVGTTQFASTAEAVLDYFRAVGIRARFRSMERVAYLTAWKDKKLKNLLFCGAGGYGNAATRVENYFVTGGATGPARPAADPRLRRLARPDLPRPRRDVGPRHALRLPLRAPRRAQQTAAGQHHGALPGGIVARESRRARVRVQAAGRPALSQRRPVHRRGREVQLPPLPRGVRQAPPRAREGRAGRRSPPRAIRAAHAVARLPGVLCHAGYRRRLDRPQEVSRAGRRGGLQAPAGGA